MLCSCVSYMGCDVSVSIGFVGLCGGSASGKTTVANKIIEALDVPWVVLLSMDSFYKVALFKQFLVLLQHFPPQPADFFFFFLTTGVEQRPAGTGCQERVQLRSS